MRTQARARIHLSGKRSRSRIRDVRRQRLCRGRAGASVAGPRNGRKIKTHLETNVLAGAAPEHRLLEPAVPVGATCHFSRPHVRTGARGPHGSSCEREHVLKKHEVTQLRPGSPGLPLMATCIQGRPQHHIRDAPQGTQKQCRIGTRVFSRGGSALRAFV